MKLLTVHDLKLYGFKNLGMVNDFRVYCKKGFYVSVKKGKFKSFLRGKILDCNPTFQSLEWDSWFNFGPLASVSVLITVSNLKWNYRFEIGEKLTKHEVVLQKEKTKTLYRPIHVMRDLIETDGLLTIKGWNYQKETI